MITVDAKQRHVLIQPEIEERLEGDRTVLLRMCAEPSPDVFAAIATSGSGSLGFDAEARSGEGAFGLSASETAATIERTQTINLLRESFFRTCERYLNGAISKDTFIVQAGRDARAMVAVLAIEQLTGTIRPPATIINGPAVSANAQLSSELVSLYAAASKRRDEAEAAYKPLKGKEDVDCSKLAADARPACEADKTKAAAAKAEPDTANARVAEIVKLSGNVGQGTGALASTTTAANQPGGSTTPPSRSDIAVVADTVKAIVKEVTQVDDMKLFCIERLAPGNIKDAGLRDSCLELLSRSAQFEAESFNEAIDALGAERHKHRERFAAVRDKLGVGDSCSAKLASQNLTSSELKRLCNSSQETSLRAFNRLLISEQENILTLLEEKEE